MNTESREQRVITFQALSDPTWVPVSAIVGCLCALLVLCCSFHRPWNGLSWLFIGSLCAVVVYWLLKFKHIAWINTIDIGAGTVLAQQRLFGFLLRQRKMPLDDVEAVTVFDENESWFAWIWDIFRSRSTTDTGFGYELAVRSRYRYGIVLQAYSEASEALVDAKMLCELLDVPLRETTTRRLRTITNEDRETPYAEMLAGRSESAFSLSGPPVETIAEYRYSDSNLMVHIPTRGYSLLSLLLVSSLVVFLIVVAGWAELGFDAWAKILLLVLMGLGALGWLVWSMIQAGRYEAWLTVSADALTLQIRSSTGLQEWDLSIEQLRDIWLSDNVGPLEQTGWECLWVGRKALEISSEDEETIPFGLGLSRAELVWLQQLVDWVISGRSGEQLQAVLTASPNMFVGVQDEEIALESEETFSTTWGSASLKRSVRPDMKYIGQWVILMAVFLGGIGVAVRPDLVPERSDPPAPVVDEDFRKLTDEIDRLRNSEDFKRGMEKYRQLQEAQSQPADG
jgi:hypothetical protein